MNWPIFLTFTLWGVISLGERTEGGQCGDSFRDAAASSLSSVVSPPLSKCLELRLLLVHQDASYFEGAGSTILQTAEAVAEGFHSGRAVLLGPHVPHFFVNASCRAAHGFECYFQPLSSCRYELHVHR